MGRYSSGVLLLSLCWLFCLYLYSVFVSSVYRFSRRPVGIVYGNQVITVFILYGVLHCIYVICSQVVRGTRWYCIR